MALLAWALGVGAAAAAGWVSVDPATGQCVAQHPPQHRYHAVQDTFTRREDLAAVEAALKKRARDELKESVCANRSPKQCAEIMKASGVQVAVDPARRIVCGAALVASDVVADPDGSARHEAALREAGARLAAALNGAPLGALEARWATGCGAGGPGARLTALIRDGVLSKGGKVTAGEGDRAVALLTPGEPMSVELWRYPAGKGASELVATAQVAPGWLGVLGAAGDQCHGAGGLGAKGGQRGGAGGLRVELALSGAEGLCTGEAASAVLRPSGAAAVQLWSVGRTGEAWLTWTSAGLGGAIDRRVTLDLEASYVPALGEEQLVVLAAPSFAQLPSGAPGCRLPALPPPGADVAVATAPFAVLPPGVDRCPVDAPAGPSWAEWQAAPVCR